MGETVTQLSLAFPKPRRGHRVVFGSPMLPPHKFRMDGTCWVWLGATIKSRDGNLYGRCRDENGDLELVHRVMYRRYHGEIPEGYEVHHACSHTLCGSPAHLQSVLEAANRRMRRKQRRKQ